MRTCRGTRSNVGHKESRRLDCVAAATARSARRILGLGEAEVHTGRVVERLAVPGIESVLRTLHALELEETVASTASRRVLHTDRQIDRWTERQQRFPSAAGSGRRERRRRMFRCVSSCR